MHWENLSSWLGSQGTHQKDLCFGCHAYGNQRIRRTSSNWANLFHCKRQIGRFDWNTLVRPLIGRAHLFLVNLFDQKPHTGLFNCNMSGNTLVSLQCSTSDKPLPVRVHLSQFCRKPFDHWASNTSSSLLICQAHLLLGRTLL